MIFYFGSNDMSYVHVGLILVPMIRCRPCIMITTSFSDSRIIDLVYVDVVGKIAIHHVFIGMRVLG